jgi:arsenate reductase (glutaredoxin)
MERLVDVWFNPRCSKCRITKAALDEAGLTYNLRYYLADPPSKAELEGVLTRLGLEPWQICRTGDALGLGVQLPAAKAATHRGEWVDLMTANPALIQRPLVVAGDGTAYVTRDPESIELAIEHSR